MSRTYVFDFYNLYIPKGKKYIDDEEGIKIFPLKLDEDFEKNRKQISNIFSENGWKITTDEYDRKCHELKDRQYQINEQLKNYLRADENFKITVNTALSIASKAYELFERSNIEQKRKLISFVFSNLELKGTTLQYSLKKPFDLMVNCSTYQEWLGD